MGPPRCAGSHGQDGKFAVDALNGLLKDRDLRALSCAQAL
jgi:hypothetical protein